MIAAGALVSEHRQLGIVGQDRFYEVLHRPCMIDWYWKLHDYTIPTYPDREHDVWHQNQDRAGRRTEPVIENLPVKDPFHLPRALVYAIILLRA